MATEPESRFTIRAIDRTQKVFASVRSGLNAISRQAQLFATIGAIAFAGFVSSGLNAGDSIAKAGDQMQIATEKVQAYRNAMELSGGSVESLDKAIITMNKNIGMAIRDGGTYERVFASIGLESAKLGAMGTDKAFEAIGTAISKLPTPAQQTAAAMQIFGRNAKDMLVLFKDGTGAIDDAKKDIEELGIALNRVDAAKIEIAGDQLQRIKQAGQGLSMIFAANLAPIIDDLSERFLNSAKEVGGLNSIVEKVIRIGGKGFAYLGNIIRGWELIVKTGRVAFAGLFEFVLNGISGIIRGFELAIGKMAYKIDQLSNNIHRATKGMVDISLLNFKGFEIDDTLKESAQAFRDAKTEMLEELTLAASEPLPTDKFDEWLEEVKAKNEAAATEIAAASEKRAYINVGVEELEAEKKKLDDIMKAREENLSHSQSISRSLLSISEQTAGEQSGIFKAMFAASKGFAIAEAIVKIQQGIANAAALAFPANLGAMATVAAATSSIVSNIQGTNLSFEGGGGFSIPNTGRAGGLDGRGGVPFVAHPGETVQVTDHTKGNPQGGQTIIQNITINGRLTEAEKRETAKNGAEMALSMMEERTYRNPNLRRNF